MKTLILFSDGRWVRQYLDDFAHRREARKSLMLAWLIRVATHSHLTHVSFSYCGRVFEPMYGGNAILDTEYYVKYHPGLVVGVEVELQHPPCLEQFDLGVRKTPWPTVVRAFSFGWPMVDDCVCDTMMILRQGGFPVPQHVLSPAALYHWLVDHKGCHHVFF